MARRSQTGGENLGRCLLLSLVVLLAAALLLEFHLVPAKRRLWQIRRHHQAMEAEIRELERRHGELLGERKALLDDPMYQERLMRRNFRLGTDQEEIYLKPGP